MTQSTKRGPGRPTTGDGDSRPTQICATVPAHVRREIDAIAAVENISRSEAAGRLWEFGALQLARFRAANGFTLNDVLLSALKAKLAVMVPTAAELAEARQAVEVELESTAVPAD